MKRLFFTLILVSCSSKPPIKEEAKEVTFKAPKDICLIQTSDELNNYNRLISPTLCSPNKENPEIAKSYFIKGVSAGYSREDNLKEGRLHYRQALKGKKRNPGNMNSTKNRSQDELINIEKELPKKSCVNTKVILYFYQLGALCGAAIPDLDVQRKGFMNSCRKKHTIEECRVLYKPPSLTRNIESYKKAKNSFTDRVLVDILK